MNKKIMLVLLLLCMNAAHGFIYQIHVLRKWDSEHERYQYVIGLGDWHDKVELSTKQQRAYLEKLLPQCDVATTKVIVEDLSTNSTGGQAQCGSFVVNTRGGILGGLAQNCFACGLSVDNVEYRYCRVASVGPLLRASHIDAGMGGASCTVKVGDIVREVSDVMSECHAYQDPKVAYFANSALKDSVKNMQKLHLDRHIPKSMNDYVKAHSHDLNRLGLLNSLLVFDSELMDAKIVNSVVASPDKQTVLVIAGGTHTKKSAEFLQKLGYELVYESDINYMKEYDLSRCVGAHIEKGTFCERPCAVSIDCIERYLP